MESNANGGVKPKSVAPNDDGDDVKERSDLHADCKEIPIKPYGVSDRHDTYDFSGEAVSCKNCSKGKSGYDSRSFSNQFVLAGV